MTLDESYALCRGFNKRHGTTYYWSTKALPKVKQHHVHALYAFARYADDIVDEIPSQGGATYRSSERAAALADFGERFFVDLAAGRSDDPVLKAVVHTVRAFDIDPDAFRRFLRVDDHGPDGGSYDTWDDLLVYIDGSAAVIGEMMLPILEPTDYDVALPHARDLGIAFQLTNFLRDIGEDLDRGRQYLPLEDRARFGVDLAERRVTPEFVELMRFEIARCRELYARPTSASRSSRSFREVRRGGAACCTAASSTRSSRRATTCSRRGERVDSAEGCRRRQTARDMTRRQRRVGARAMRSRDARPGRAARGGSDARRQRRTRHEAP